MRAHNLVMKSFRAQSNRHSVSCLAGFQSVDVARGSSPRYVRFPFCTCSIIQALNISGSERSFLAKNPHFLAKTISRRGQPPKRFSLISPRAAIATSSDVMGVSAHYLIVFSLVVILNDCSVHVSSNNFALLCSSR